MDTSIERRELPAWNPTKPSREQGLFGKFIVTRVDGSDQPGGKHHGCEYFVLDTTHDKYARAALLAYAEACKATHPQLAADLVARWAPGVECHGLDTPERICFYEQDYYVLSNFSAFKVMWSGRQFDTSEAAYHYMKFPDDKDVQMAIRHAPSAHAAFKIAESHKSLVRADWSEVKVDIMHQILTQKALQHEYVRRKLLATGDRELVENSWRDSYWGWGPNRDGQNMLGKLWMQVRAELREQMARGDANA